MTTRIQTLPQYLASRRRPSLLGYLCMGLGIYLVGLVLCVIALFSTTILCEVVGTSMDGTLFDGEYILLNRLDREFERGEIVVFYSEQNRKDIVKRVIGISGDSLRFVPGPDGTALLERMVAGGDAWVLVDEPYINEPMRADFFGGLEVSLNEVIVVPSYELFVLGDNRNMSEDSRSFGTIATHEVKGTMYAYLRPGSWEEWMLRFLYSA